MLLFKVVRSAEFEVSLAVLIAGNKLMCDVSYRDAVCSQLVTIQHYYCRLLNLSSPILDQSHVFRRRTDENEPSPAVLVVGFTASWSLQMVWLPELASFLVLETLTPPSGFRQNVISSPPLT